MILWKLKKYIPAVTKFIGSQISRDKYTGIIGLYKIATIENIITVSFMPLKFLYVSKMI